MFLNESLFDNPTKSIVLEEMLELGSDLVISESRVEMNESSKAIASLQSIITSCQSSTGVY